MDQMDEFRAELSKIIRKEGGERLKELCKNSGDPNDLNIMENIERAMTNYVATFLEERMKKTEEALEKCANKVDKLGKIVEHMHIGWTTERRKRLKVEADILANVVFINGIEFHENATKDKRYETPVETMQKTHEFLAAIKHETSTCGITEAIRLPRRHVSNGGNSFLSNTIRVSFVSFTAKMALYRALATNGNANKNIKVQDAVPSDLMGDKKELE